jgi:hypothetical protein
MNRLIRVSRRASLARRALTLRSRNRANCLRRKRFSAARAQCGRRLSLMNLKASSSRWRTKSDRESSFGVAYMIALGASLGGMK